MQYYYVLEKIQHQNNRIDNIHTSILHIYCILLLLTSLIMFHLIVS